MYLGFGRLRAHQRPEVRIPPALLDDANACKRTRQDNNRLESIDTMCRITDTTNTPQARPKPPVSRKWHRIDGTIMQPGITFGNYEEWEREFPRRGNGSVSFLELNIAYFTHHISPTFPWNSFLTGTYPLWTRRCCLRLSWRLKSLSQPGNGHLCGFS